MISARRNAVVVLLAVSLTGCTHKTKTTPPAQAQAPTTGTTSPGAVYPPPLTTPSPEVQTPAQPPPQPVAEQPPPPAPAPAPEKPKKTAPHKKTKPDKPADESQPATAAAPDAQPPAQPPAQQAANGSAGTSPIGNLTTDDAGTNAQERQEAQDIINATENGLNTVVKKSLTQDQQNTVTQIRTFLEKAKQAVGADDPVGAKTFATKAKVLLDELTKQ